MKIELIVTPPDGEAEAPSGELAGRRKPSITSPARWGPQGLISV